MRPVLAAMRGQAVGEVSGRGHGKPFGQADSRAGDGDRLLRHAGAPGQVRRSGIATGRKEVLGKREKEKTAIGGPEAGLRPRAEPTVRPGQAQERQMALA
jgi:hypothetical protein